MNSPQKPDWLVAYGSTDLISFLTNEQLNQWVPDSMWKRMGLRGPCRLAKLDFVITKAVQLLEMLTSDRAEISEADLIELYARAIRKWTVIHNFFCYRGDEERKILRTLPTSFATKKQVRDTIRRLHQLCMSWEGMYVVANDHCQEHFKGRRGQELEQAYIHISELFIECLHKFGTEAARHFCNKVTKEDRAMCFQQFIKESGGDSSLIEGLRAQMNDPETIYFPIMLLDHFSSNVEGEDAECLEGADNQNVKREQGGMGE